VQPPHLAASQGSPSSTTAAGALLGSGGARTAPRFSEKDLQEFQAGTTKGSQHCIPGYTGHIGRDPSTRQQGGGERSHDRARDLHMLNYKGPCPGYTGKRML
jgi:hypothetical protein